MYQKKKKMYHFLPEIVSDKSETFFKQVARGKERTFLKRKRLC